MHNLKTYVHILLPLLFAMAALAQNSPTNVQSQLLSVEGRVEVAPKGSATWAPGVTNQLLQNGDRIRTGVRSRATIQLSDRSVLRLNELTTLEIRPPQSASASAGFELKSGASYFFNRERPGSVEFRTPLASGAIRGTEFNLLVAENGRTEVTLLDGLVDLSNDLGTANLLSGEQGVVEPGQPPRKTAMLDARSIIQWVLYYPAVIDVDHHGLSLGRFAGGRGEVSGQPAAWVGSGTNLSRRHTAGRRAGGTSNTALAKRHLPLERCAKIHRGHRERFAGFPGQIASPGQRMDGRFLRVAGAVETG